MSTKRQKIWLWTWKLSWPQAIDTINSALKLGYHTIDTAWIYQNAPEIASAIKESWVPRSELFITSKTRFDYIPNYQKHQFQKSDFSYSLRKQRFEKHLQELETDYLDELLIHRPTREENDCPTWTPLLLPTKRNHQTYLSIKFSALLPQTASLKAPNPSLLQSNRTPPLSFWSRDDQLYKNQQPANHCLFTACSLTSPQKSNYQSNRKKTSSKPSSNLYCSMFSSMSKPYS